MEWTITPLCMGILEVNKSIEMAFTGFSETLQAPCIAWLLRSGSTSVLVDAGPADPQWSLEHHRPLHREEHQYLPAALRAQGIEPESIEGVIATHLHWDHCWGIKDIPSAKVYVQREEMRYAAAPLPCDAGPYETAFGFMLMASFYNRIVPVDGDMELLPGIQLLSTPGHTPGSQCVAVNTPLGVQVIAGDLVGLYEALESDPPHVPGIFYKLEDCYASLRKIRAISTVVLPGHDMAVFEKMQQNQAG